MEKCGRLLREKAAGRYVPAHYLEIFLGGDFKKKEDFCYYSDPMSEQRFLPQSTSCITIYEHVIWYTPEVVSGKTYFEATSEGLRLTFLLL